MMLPTHVVLGLGLAAPLVVFAPKLAPVALAGALVGSVLPDLDMYTGHRRTLHYPTGYAIVAVPAVLAAVLFGTPWLIALAFGLLAATLHCRLDRYGGGLELRPWTATSDRAVYDHIKGRWRRPKRWIRYDGAPEDVVLLVLGGAPLLVVLEGPFRWIVAGSLIVGFVYGLLRRRLASLAPIIAAGVPAPMVTYVPERYRQ